MKFWQLESICRWHGGSALVDALSDPRWREFEAIHQNYTQLVESQNREKLDRSVPLELASAVFSKLSFRFVLNDKNLRLAPDGDESGIPAINALRRFGGEAVEEVLEKGSVKVSV